VLDGSLNDYLVTVNTQWGGVHQVENWNGFYTTLHPFAFYLTDSLNGIAYSSSQT
jgi:hypothetical protein